MRTRGLFRPALLGAGVLLAGVASGLASQLNSPGLRPTNVELYIVSQSCLQGEVVPCG